MSVHFFYFCLQLYISLSYSNCLCIKLFRYWKYISDSDAEDKVTLVGIMNEDGGENSCQVNSADQNYLSLICTELIGS